MTRLARLIRLTRLVRWAPLTRLVRLARLTRLIRSIPLTRHLRAACRVAVFLLTAGHATAQELRGTLFTTPQEREYLDYLRQDFLAHNQSGGFDIEEAQVPEIPGATAAPLQPVEYALGGIMTLGDGTRTVWLNERAIAERDLPTGMRIVSDGGVPALRLSTDTGTYLLRPGQTVEVRSGVVQERYQRPQPAAEEGATDTSAPPEQEPAASQPRDAPAATDANAGSATAAPSSSDGASATPAAQSDGNTAGGSSIVSNRLISGLPVTLSTEPGTAVSAQTRTEEPEEEPEDEPAPATLDNDSRLTEILDAIQDLQDELDARR